MSLATARTEFWSSMRLIRIMKPSSRSTPGARAASSRITVMVSTTKSLVIWRKTESFCNGDWLCRRMAASASSVFSSDSFSPPAVTGGAM